MVSFIRISDIPSDELHLLPITGLRQQIREDRSRLISPNSRIDEGETDGSLPGRPHRAEAAAAEVPLAAEERFVTDWQLQDEPRPSPRLPFGKEDSDDDSEDEDAGEEQENYRADGTHDTAEDFDALYVDIGGEG
jgi:hypothetical protein